MCTLLCIVYPHPPLISPPLPLINNHFFKFQKQIFCMVENFEKKKSAKAIERKKYKMLYPDKIRKNKHEYKKRHPQKNRSGNNRRNANIRIEVLKKYSNSEYPFCAKCGTLHLEFLEVDHIMGGGREHSRNIKTNLHRWLRQNNYPDGFQVLCSNCNTKKYRLYCKSKAYNGTEKQKYDFDRLYAKRLQKLNENANNNVESCECCGEIDQDVLCMTKEGKILCCNCSQSITRYGYCPHNLPTRYEYVEIQD